MMDGVIGFIAIVLALLVIMMIIIGLIIDEALTKIVHRLDVIARALQSGARNWNE